MIDIDELKRLNEKATPAPWGIYADQPSVEITRSDGKRIADVDTWTGKGCLDADLIIYLRNHVHEIIQLLSIGDATKPICSRCGQYIMASYEDGLCYAEDGEPQIMHGHDEAIFDDAPEERGQTYEELLNMYGPGYGNEDL
jgi:hypothetical protein